MKARVVAYSKLNLSLEVVGLRSDGFHEIRSIMQTIDLADRIDIAPGVGIHVSCSVKLNGANIVEQAVRELLREKRTRTGVTIHVEKNIPIGAGLGGGSSDAAAVLATINRLIPPVLPPSVLVEIAGRIGSDVALFLTGGCMSVADRGEPRRQLPLRDETYVLLVPNIHCSTGDIYRAWQPADRSATEQALGRNDLYPAAARLYPELRVFRDAIDGVGALYSGMTGSGSGFFAAFPDCTEASAAAEHLTRQQGNCRVYYCRPTSTGFAEPTNAGSQPRGERHEDRD